MSENVLTTTQPGGIATAARPLRPVSVLQRLNIRGTLLLGLILLAIVLLVALFASVGLLPRHSAPDIS